MIVLIYLGVVFFFVIFELLVDICWYLVSFLLLMVFDYGLMVIYVCIWLIVKMFYINIGFVLVLKEFVFLMLCGIYGVVLGY